MKNKSQRLIGQAIEALELRRLMSASLMGSGQLLVDGNATEANAITVGLDASGSSIDVTINDGAVQAFTLADVKRLTIIGGAANDTINIDQTNHPFVTPTHIFAGMGDDSVQAGDEDDYISGAGGADTLNSGNGNDTVRGGSGNDFLACGSGDDSLMGNQGADTLSAGTGNDLLKGGNGNDSMQAGSGQDTMIGGGGQDSLFGGTGASVLIGGRGANAIHGGAGHDTVIGAGGDDEVSAGAGDLMQSGDAMPPIADAPAKRAPAAVPSVAHYGSVTGTVDDSGAPVAGATVLLTAMNPSRGAFNAANAFSVTTDAQGHYAFSDLPTGSYFVFARKSDHGFANQTITITDGSSIKLNLHLVMFINVSRATGGIGGIISDTSGNAVAGATVLLVRESVNNYGPGVPMSQGDEREVTTDAKGAYAFKNLPAGQYLIVAYSPTFGQGQAQWNNGGSQSTQNITLETSAPTIAKPSAFTGTITDMDGDALAGVFVTVLPYPFNVASGGTDPSSHGTFGPEEWFVTTDAKGKFTVAGLAAGTYSIEVYLLGHRHVVDSGEKLAGGQTEVENFSI